MDVATVEYDISLVDAFMTLTSKDELVIDDLSSPDVPTGEFYIGVHLTDGENILSREILVKIYDSFETPIVDESSSDSSSNDGSESGASSDEVTSDGSSESGSSDTGDA